MSIKILTLIYQLVLLINRGKINVFSPHFLPASYYCGVLVSEATETWREMRVKTDSFASLQKSSPTDQESF
jgi:hypothetical protein